LHPPDNPVPNQMFNAPPGIFSDLGKIKYMNLLGVKDLVAGEFQGLDASSLYDLNISLGNCLQFSYCEEGPREGGTIETAVFADITHANNPEGARPALWIGGYAERVKQEAFEKFWYGSFVIGASGPNSKWPVNVGCEGNAAMHIGHVDAGAFNGMFIQPDHKDLVKCGWAH
jgi:hypothetical protein